MSSIKDNMFKQETKFRNYCLFIIKQLENVTLIDENSKRITKFLLLAVMLQKLSILYFLNKVIV